MISSRDVVVRITEGGDYSLYGQQLYPSTITCSECGTHVTIMVDPEDVRRFRDYDIESIVAFASGDGLPYLNPAERELLISGICVKCLRAVFGD